MLFMFAAAATGGDVTVKNVIPKHLEATTAKLEEMDVRLRNLMMQFVYVHQRDFTVLM